MQHLVWGIVDDAAFVCCDAMVGRCTAFNIGKYGVMVHCEQGFWSRNSGQVVSSNGPSLARNTDVKIN